MNILIRNTITNYLSMAVRLAQTILLTRWILQYLGQDYYGLWSLLWTFFAYALLLDFGFGISAQKYTSTGLCRTDPEKYNRTMSAIFLFHLVMAFIIILAATGVSFFLPRLLRISDPAQMHYIRTCYFLFAFGSAAVFPTGMFPEILVGLKRLDLRNYIIMFSKVLELILTFAVFYFGGKLASLIILSSAMALLANLIMLVFILRLIPGLRFVMKIDFERYREVFSFSGFVYIISLAHLLRSKTSEIIISFFCGLPDVALYHLSGRIANLCLTGAAQYSENVVPVTASLYAGKRFDELNTFVMNSMRWSVFIGILLMLPAAIASPELFRFLFKASGDDITAISRVMMGNMFCYLVFVQTPYNVLLMVEKHRFLSCTMIVYALATLGVNIVLLQHYGIISIAIASIFMEILLAGSTLIPMMFRTLHIHPIAFIMKVYVMPLILAVPGALISFFLRSVFGGRLGAFWSAAMVGVVCSGIFFLLYVTLLLGRGERREIIARFLPGARRYSD